MSYAEHLPALSERLEMLPDGYGHFPAYSGVYFIEDQAGLPAGDEVRRT